MCDNNGLPSSSCNNSSTSVMISQEESNALMDVGFMFDASIEKTTQSFTYGRNVNVTLSCIQQEPGALQSGHYVWPAAPGLCEYLVSNWESLPTANGGIVLELGAGCGLAGLVAAQLLRKSETPSCVIFTDHDPGVLRTIEHNVSLQKSVLAPCRTQRLSWGPYGKGDITFSQNSPISLLIGTDVIYAKEVVKSLFWTVNELQASMFLMCSSFAYDTLTEEEIERVILEFGFVRKILQCDLPTGGVRIQSFCKK